MKHVKDLDFYRAFNLVGCIGLSLCAATLCFMPDTVLAATVGDQLSRITTEAQTAWIPFIKIMALIMGMGFFVIGLMKFHRAQGGMQGGGVGEGIKYLVIGACLMGIGAVSLMVGGSVAGEGAIDSGAWN